MTTTQTNIKDFVEVRGLSLPIMIVPRVESISYALRMTPLGKYEHQDLIDFLLTFDDYIVVREVSKKHKEHYHVVLFTDQFEDIVRERIRAFLLIHFTDPPKRGDANKQYNLSQIDDLQLAITYILKDSTLENPVLFSSNVNGELIIKLQKKSYKKYSKDEFMKELEVLKSKFKDDLETDIHAMMCSVVRLKSLYRQPINMTQIHQMCISFDVHNRPNLADVYVSEFLSRFR